jgi:hypothetical protein
MEPREAQNVPAEWAEAIQQALRDFKSPNKLKNSRCLETCLVSKRLDARPGVAPRELLREIFEDVLVELEENNPENADILRGRFWEGLSSKEMFGKGRPQPWAERTFYEHQTEALKEFVHLFWEREQVCRTATAEIATSPDQRQRSLTQNRQRVVVAASLILLGLGIVLIWVISYANSTPRPPSLGSASPSATLVMDVLPVTAIAGKPATTIALSPTADQTSAVTPAPSAALSRFKCGGPEGVQVANAGVFLRHQGISTFTVESSSGAVLSNKVRSLAIDPRGVWIGYFATDQHPGNGVGQFNRQSWADCGVPGEGAGKNINALAIDSKGQVWAATEKEGVLMFDGTRWRSYTLKDGLPSNEAFGLTIEKDDNVWVGTWEGVAKYNGRVWSVPYKEGEGTIYNNHVHAIAFDSEGNIWVGHMGRGVSQFRNADGKWINHRAEKGTIGGDVVYAITVRKADAARSESVWFVTSNGVSSYESGMWKTYRKGDGLPDDTANAVAIDRYNRVWAATAGGVAYLDGGRWVTYDTVPTLSIAFGPPCSGCPYDTDHVWTGTATMGLAHSRIPYPVSVPVLDVISVRYQKIDTPDEPFQNEIVVAPGEEFLAEIVVSPRSPYTLVHDSAIGRGDLLSSIEEGEEKRYGAYVQMEVTGTVESGQRFTFVDTDNPFRAPQLPDGVDEQKFTSRWRVWMYTRYVGPIIEVVFTVRRPSNQPTVNPTVVVPSSMRPRPSWLLNVSAR